MNPPFLLKVTNPINEPTLYMNTQNKGLGTNPFPLLLTPPNTKN